MRHHFTLKGPFSLLPIAFFLLIFIGSGVYFTLQGVELAFYKVSASVAILPAIFLAVFLGRHSLSDNIAVFIEGVREKNIITMCMIYLLAGAYTEVLKGIGGVDATVYFALQFVPKDATLAGVFLIGAFVSTSMGTSMGTIAAIAPIAVGISQALGLDPSLMAGAVISGAMFGDNLSMISDTTIAATQIHSCSLKDKFNINLFIALVPLLLTLILYLLSAPGEAKEIPLNPNPPDLIFTFPYIFVLIIALLGVNVFIVLSAGLFVGSVIGLFFSPSYTFLELAKNIFEGYTSMNEILVLSLLIGGLSELAKNQGGIRFIVQLVDALIQKWGRRAQGSRIAESAISLLVSICDFCTANNTIAIILAGEATLEISQKYRVPMARTAALVTIFSCVFQGILPYSAQVLLAGSLAGVSPLSVVPYIYYCYLLGISAIVAIIFRLPKLQKN
ncbi:MAG: Na+/H+ antiporter [uncultured bacterium]|nr:MAG: Na+/H+ antiporter [uncultured bacterium]OFW68438.1 MAG: sodium:proton antiporter [Alphaproteobacteria bacterium GWC2_42_16]OFW72970.1 MAG: sodium:proton antiporter [Alphaproteobacteria bacterium GWA2_41_27]OFW81530.1 MAG: sodium:proton antiporter [Alphaproteobacteria bacterium RIFCSPHIGHO2_12_FULL_42_100]OFW86782.1 MAG: sodium:proton antiporter [Alphaproteobacteria bacterium RBG_16_42_14]OFW90456.1 MAG: sodium:proton antiporter [Alphaproteobacteria bacterium RIFCSPHIGHO2_02_FULL_42_30]